jgi:phosphoglycerate dehydrogenase-like enzyme
MSKHCVWVRLDLPAEESAALRHDLPEVDFLNTADPGDTALAGVTIMLTREAIDEQTLDRMPRLEWVQVTPGGANRYLSPSLVRRPIRLTTCRGIHGPVFAEFALGLILALHKRLPAIHTAQRLASWDPTIAPDQLAGKTVGVIGLGSIGSAVAHTLKALGLRVVATRRQIGAAPSHVDELRTADQLPWLLREADVVVLCVPANPQTSRLIGEAELRMMKRGAYFIRLTAGREPVDQEPIVKAIREGWISGAGLNLASDSVLPADSALWHLPNVIICPGLAGEDGTKWAQQRALFVDNLRRFTGGQPLRNLVDKQHGY